MKTGKLHRDNSYHRRWICLHTQYSTINKLSTLDASKMQNTCLHCLVTFLDLSILWIWGLGLGEASIFTPRFILCFLWAEKWPLAIEGLYVCHMVWPWAEIPSGFLALIANHTMHFYPFHLCSSWSHLHPSECLRERAAFHCLSCFAKSLHGKLKELLVLLTGLSCFP